MKLSRAKNMIFWIWTLLSGPILIIILLQLIFGRYADWTLPWGWISPLIFPPLALVVAGMPIHKRNHGEEAMVARSFPLAVVWLSLVYFVCLYAVILTEPFSNLTYGTIFAWSGIILGFVQGVVVAMIFRIYIPEE